MVSVCVSIQCLHHQHHLAKSSSSDPKQIALYFANLIKSISALLVYTIIAFWVVVQTSASSRKLDTLGITASQSWQPARQTKASDGVVFKLIPKQSAPTMTIVEDTFMVPSV